MYQINRFLAADAGGAPGAGATGGAEGAAASGAAQAAGGEAAAAGAGTGAKTETKPSLEELLKDPAFKAEYDRSAKTEADRLAKLSATEREAEEKKAFQTEREQFNREKLETETAKQLALKGLPTDFAKQLTGKDATETLANIAAFEKQYNAALEKGVNDRLKGSSPKAGGTTAASGAAAGGSKSGMMAAISEVQFKR